MERRSKEIRYNSDKDVDGEILYYYSRACGMCWATKAEMIHYLYLSLLIVLTNASQV